MDYDNVEIIDQANNNLKLQVKELPHILKSKAKHQQTFGSTIQLWDQHHPHPSIPTTQEESLNRLSTHCILQSLFSWFSKVFFKHNLSWHLIYFALDEFSWKKVTWFAEASNNVVLQLCFCFLLILFYFKFFCLFKSFKELTRDVLFFLRSSQGTCGRVVKCVTHEHLQAS